MTTAATLLKAHRFGIKDFKTHLSERIKSRQPMVLLDRGEPKKVIMDYGELVEMLELIDELQDSELLHLIKDGREGLQKNKLGINAEDSLARLRSSKRN